jgi:hypothetical protein
MKFPVRLGPKQFHTKFPYFKLQLWDKDVFSFSDAIGEKILNLKGLFEKAYETEQQHEQNNRNNNTNTTRYLLFEDTKNPKQNEEEKIVVRKIKEVTGIGWDEEDPMNSTWVKIEQFNHETNERKYMGEICLSMELLPKKKAKAHPVGFGRSAPNHSPFLPPPAGRLSFVS